MDLDQLLQKQREFFRSGATMPVDFRIAMLRKLRGAMERQERVGFGLSAVNQRLMLQFGPEYGLRIDSEEGMGTTVTARIPYTRKEAVSR